MNVVKRHKDGKLVEYTIDGVNQSLNEEQVLVEWPLILRPMKLLAKSTDRGLGDIIERTIGPIGGEAYKQWYEKIFGKPCKKCDKRQNNLNIRFPL